MTSHHQPPALDFTPLLFQVKAPRPVFQIRPLLGPDLPPFRDLSLRLFRHGNRRRPGHLPARRENPRRKLFWPPSSNCPHSPLLCLRPGHRALGTMRTTKSPAHEPDFPLLIQTLRLERLEQLLPSFHTSMAVSIALILSQSAETPPPHHVRPGRAGDLLHALPRLPLIVDVLPASCSSGCTFLASARWRTSGSNSFITGRDDPTPPSFLRPGTGTNALPTSWSRAGRPRHDCGDRPLKPGFPGNTTSSSAAAISS